MYFNPRPRKEGDSTGDADDELIKNFNPRPRKEGDPSTITQHTAIMKFQSTPSQRGRRGGTIPPPLIIISIHALAKRATIQNEFLAALINNFNPRPRKEGDDLPTRL